MLPAISARFWTRDITGLIALATAIGIASSVIGLLVSFHVGLPSRPGHDPDGGRLLRGCRCSSARSAAGCCGWSPAAISKPDRSDASAPCPTDDPFVLSSSRPPWPCPGRFRPRPAAPAERIAVVASFSILGDFVRQVGGDRVGRRAGRPERRRACVPAHPGRRQDAGRRQARGGQRPWPRGLDRPRLVKASGSRAPVVTASAGVKPLETARGRRRPHADPHAWQDVANAKAYVAAIRDGLSAADPAGKAVYDGDAARLSGAARRARRGGPRRHRPDPARAPADHHHP